MRVRSCLAAVLAVAGSVVPVAARATTYEVGPGQPYPGLGSLPALAAGDVVEINAGTYNEVRRWTESGTAAAPITIRGVGSPRPVIDATGLVVDGSLPNPRAVFQIEGGNIVVENLELKNARNGDNGSGIRVTGAAAQHVVIRNCLIDNNDMGIMSDGNDDLLIESSEIANNGTASFSGYSHNFYLGGQSTTVRGCYIHDALYGQNVKSRGHFTALLYNTIADSQDGEVGLVDEAETAQPSSNAVLIGNVVVSKPRLAGFNHVRFILFGQDLGGAHDGVLTLLNNTFVAGDGRIAFLDSNATGASIVATNNIFLGSDTLASGNGPVSGSNNWAPASAAIPAGLSGTVTAMAPGLVDPAARDFHLTMASPCRDAALNGASFADGNGATQPGVPRFEYVVDLQTVARPSDGRLDIGAYEFGTVATPDGGAGADAGAGNDAGGGGGDAGSPGTMAGGGCGCAVGERPSRVPWLALSWLAGVAAARRAARRRRS